MESINIDGNFLVISLAEKKTWFLFMADGREIKITILTMSKGDKDVVIANKDINNKLRSLLTTLLISSERR